MHPNPRAATHLLAFDVEEAPVEDEVAPAFPLCQSHVVDFYETQLFLQEGATFDGRQG